MSSNISTDEKFDFLASAGEMRMFMCSYSASQASSSSGLGRPLYFLFVGSLRKNSSSSFLRMRLSPFWDAAGFVVRALSSLSKLELGACCSSLETIAYDV